MNKISLHLLCLLLLFSFSCSREEEDNLDTQLEEILNSADPVNGKEGFRLPNSFDYGSIPQDPANPITPEKVTLGRLLYHETGLATNSVRQEGKGTYSCASCHFASAGFQAGRFQGIGDGGTGIGSNGFDRLRFTTYLAEELDVQPIRTPTTLNVAYQELMLWNGQFGAGSLNEGTEAQWERNSPLTNNHLGYQGIETQAIAGLAGHRMAVFPEPVLDELGYLSFFDAAFPDFPASERYTRETSGLAIAAYERTLLANQAPFQQYLDGETNALSPAEKRGAILFFGDANCVSCHNGPALNSMSFHALGMNDLDQCAEEVFQTMSDEPEHLGRGGFTKNIADNYKFKTPSLYNLADSPFYGHGASFQDIQEVVAYKNQGQAQNSRVPESALSPAFQPLGLSQGEVADIAVFITMALYDPELLRYQPESILSGQCFPNNDAQSSADLNCN
jgi:cytochrome c peroxidase